VHRLLQTSLFVSTLAVSILPGDGATAAIVILSVAELEALEGQTVDLETGAGTSAETEPEKPTPPPPPHDPVENGLSGGSMAASLSSSGPAGSGGAPAALITSVSLTACQLVQTIQPVEWLLIPPRFLDGVFRPPRD